MSARVVISGNLGVGKTTFGPVVANALGGIFVNESVEDNPYLDDYYRDMSRWAFHLQVHFLVNRVKTYTAPPAKECPIIFDRSFFEDANVFAPMLHDAGHLTDQEYKTYKLLYEFATANLPSPTVIIYLYAPVHVLLDRIRGRNQGFDQNITANYLYAVEQRYTSWLSAVKNSKIITLDTTQIDVRSTRAGQMVLPELQSFL